MRLKPSTVRQIWKQCETKNKEPLVIKIINLASDGKNYEKPVFASYVL